MKGKRLMMTALLAIFGFVLLALSVYLLTKNTSTTMSGDKQRQLDEAIRQIEVLHAEILEKDKIVSENELKLKSLKSQSMSHAMGQNMPIIEIVDNDLSEGSANED